jgi:hypothetical protein
MSTFHEWGFLKQCDHREISVAFTKATNILRWLHCFKNTMP